MEKYPFNEFPIEDLSSMGFNMDNLKNNQDFIFRLTHGMRSGTMACYVPDVYGNKMSTRAKIMLYRDSTTNLLKVKTFLYQDYLDYGETYFGKSFDKDEQNVLKKYKELGKTVKLLINDKLIECLVGVDTELNRLSFTPKAAIYVPPTYLGVKITDEEQKIVKAGGMIYKTNLQKEGVEPFNALLYYSNTKDHVCTRTPTPELLMMVKEYGNKPKESSFYQTINNEEKIKENISQTVANALPAPEEKVRKSRHK